MPIPASGGTNPTAASFLASARQAIGDPYVYGAAGPRAFDCSGLVQWAAEKAGLMFVPRTSEQQWAWVQHISQAQLRPGDLIFEQWPGDNASPGHVAIWLGNGKIVDATQPGQGVVVQSFSVNQVNAAGGKVVGYGRIPGLSGAGSAATAPAGPPGSPAAPVSAADPTGPLAAAGAFLHDVSLPVAWFLEFWQPGQGWRIAFGAGAVAAGAGGVKAWHSASGDPDSGALPLSVGLFGIAALAMFMALRPWPEVQGKAERPTAYAVSILQGRTPAAGPQPVPPVAEVETGLVTIAGLWAASKIASSVLSVAGAAAAGAGLWSKIRGWLGGAGKAAGDIGAAAEVP